MVPRDEFAAAVVAAMPVLYKYAISLMRGRPGADDLLQQTVEKALKHRDKFMAGRVAKMAGTPARVRVVSPYHQWASVMNKIELARRSLRDAGERLGGPVLRAYSKPRAPDVEMMRRSLEAARKQINSMLASLEKSF